MKMLKELIYTGIGAGVLLKEKVESEINKLNESGKIKTEDAKSFLQSLETKGQEEDNKIKNEIKNMLKEIIDDLGLATKEDLEKLKQQLKEEKQ